MKRIIVLLAATAMLATVAGPASAQVPPGRGLTTFDCGDPVGTVTVTRGGGGPCWVAEDGSMWLVLEGTAVADGQEFSFTSGQKKGLRDHGTATCSFTEEFEEGVVGEVTLTVVRVR